MGRASQRKKIKKQGPQEDKVLISNEVVTESIDYPKNSPQRSQEPNLPNNLIDLPSCPTCGNTEARAVLSQTIHWAQWQCTICSRHRGWIQNPTNAVKRESENRLIERLLQEPGLGTWERMFLRSVRNTRKRSPRQIQKLNDIALRLGFSALSQGGES